MLLCLFSCSQSEQKKEMTPWGQVVDERGVPCEDVDTATLSGQFSLNDIISAGELIMLTVSSPTTYYDYHGHGMGLHYLTCEKLAQKLGVSLRVETCADSTEMMSRLSSGEGDIVCYPVKDAEVKKDTLFLSCGMKDGKGNSWVVSKRNKELAARADEVITGNLVAQVEKEQKSILTNGFITRHVYPFMLNRKDAVISQYDNLFRKYANVAGVEWTLLAAQCYQESCFDPRAKSWAGACGLMQIIPSTAKEMGLPLSDIYSPEANIHAACRYMSKLQREFSDVGNRKERIKFALASYNGGFFHIRDAMALARRHGKNPMRWSDVREYVLGLQSPEYYRDPVVRYGYMRGSETVDYVDKIIDRWGKYRNATRGKYSSGVNATPTPAKRQNKWDK